MLTGAVTVVPFETKWCNYISSEAHSAEQLYLFRYCGFGTVIWVDEAQVDEAQVSVTEPFGQTVHPVLMTEFP